MKKRIGLAVPVLVIVLLALAAAIYAWGVSGWPGNRQGVTVSYGNLQSVHAAVPDDAVAGVVILVSDAGRQPDAALVEELVGQNLLVLPVSLDSWLSGLQAEASDCLYPGSDIEGIAKEVQRKLGLESYFHPVVMGQGAGAVFAFAAVADSPPATMAGGVVLDPAAGLKTDLPICPGSPAVEHDGLYSYDLGYESDEPISFVAASRPAELPASASFTATAEAAQRKVLAAAAALEIAQQDATAMPVVINRPQGPVKAVAVFFSGDGGWRDLDKTVGDWLAEHGVEVLGVDSLRYFWSEKSPQQMAADIAGILDDAKVPEGTPVALMGYSFGADTLPFAWGSLPQHWQKRTRLIALLAPGVKTGFEISIGGWLGLATGEQPVVPAVAKLPVDRTLCVFGAEEGADSACNAPELKDYRKIETGGGHHFDGDYNALAAKLLTAMLQ